MRQSTVNEAGNEGGSVTVVLPTGLYKAKYGAWAGLPAGHGPDFTHCCAEVVDNSTRWPRYHQCSKKRGHGPDGAYCKQHDPEVTKAREAASAARDRDRWNKARYEIHGRPFFDALLKIAEGHNDARGLAQEVIDTFKKGELP